MSSIRKCDYCGIQDSDVNCTFFSMQNYYHSRCAFIITQKKSCDEYFYHFSLEQKNDYDFICSSDLEYWIKDKLTPEVRQFYKEELFAHDYDGYYKNNSGGAEYARKWFREMVEEEGEQLNSELTIGVLRNMMRRSYVETITPDGITRIYGYRDDDDE